MTTERHFSEGEVSAIFERAIEAQEAARKMFPHAEGLTLQELQDIGAEIGITPEFIARAAAQVDVVTTQREVPTKKLMGMPVRIERIIELPRALTDLEWDRVVVDLRETFSARGSIKSDGSLRQWTNGNLQALVEPAGDGYRLRLRSMLANARDTAWMGVTALVLSLVSIIMISALSVPALILPGMLLAIAAACFGLNAYRVPRWHGERSSQMEGLGSRLSEMLANETLSATTTKAQSPRIDLDALPEFDGRAADGSVRGRSRE